MSEAAQPAAPTPPADPAKKGLKWVLLLIVLSLTWYLLADRITPYTQQARVGAFVIPVASEVAGRVIRVNVRNNQTVNAGDVLFEVDPQPYQIAVDRARADLEATRRQIGASTAGIASAEANLRAAHANELKARQDNQRLEGLYRDDPGTISVRLLEVSRANREQAV
ncbi:HlyD family secretion protein, partial [Pseudomonas fluorescens]|uniref:HlyD family secretion protein n=1 Tax=Pseudomonas fluorescens TaxID=294 RepID=UPI00123FFE05